MQNKRQQRQHCKYIQTQIQKNDKQKWDLIIYEKLKQYIESNKLRELCIYYSIKNEVDTTSIIKYCWNNQINVYLPKIIDKKIVFLKYDQNDNLILNNRYKILEPSINNAPMQKIIKTIFIPLIACDNQFNRLGSGGGFYDRYLENKFNIMKIALSYKVQILEEIDVELHDIKMDLIITN